MKKILFVFAAMVLFVSSNVFADDVTLTTYYPAPFGMYQEMRVMGNLGVGTTNPQNKLDVEGAVAIGSACSGTSAAPANGLIVEGSVGIGTTDSTAIGNGILFVDSPIMSAPEGVIRATNWLYDVRVGAYLAGSNYGIDINQLANYAGAGLSVNVLNASAATFMGGNVGIGTTNPTSKLTINEGSLSTALANLPVALITVGEPNRAGLVVVSSNVTGGHADVPNIGNAAFAAAGTDYAAYFAEGKVYSAGDVGIGTTNPTEALDINGQVRIRGGSPAEGNVLTSDANGVGTWQAAGGGNVNRVILFALKWNGSQLVHQKTLILSTNVPGDLTKNVVVYGTTTPTYGHYVVPVSFAGFYIDSADIVSASLVELSEVPLKVTITNTLGYNRLEFIISKDKNHHSLTTNSTIYFMCTWPSLR